jgi:hypothetical protein
MSSLNATCVKKMNWELVVYTTKAYTTLVQRFLKVIDTGETPDPPKLFLPVVQLLINGSRDCKNPQNVDYLESQFYCQ